MIATGRAGAPRGTRGAGAWAGAALLSLLALIPLAARAQESAPAAGSDSSFGAAPAPSHDILAWPFYVRWDGDDGSSVRMIGPVSGAWRAPRHRAAYLLFPTTGSLHLSGGRTEHWLAWPLTGYRRDARRGITQFSLATGLVGYRRQETEFVHSVALNPVWSDSRRANGVREWQISPLMYRRSDPARQFETTEIGVAPFLGGAGLSAWRRWSSRESHGWSAAIFWGQRFDARGGVTSMLPYVSSWQRDSVAGDSRFRALVPVWAQWRNPRHETDFLLPAWWRHHSATLNSTGFWPFYASFRRAHGDSSHHSGGSILWPLFSWGSGDDYSAFGALPLWYRVRDGDTRVTLAPPLYGR
ncbi:MAG: hypothetical protein IT348_15780, partial [Candidatus Eisenbacteria bacterium]|nr:hypothetical protein [Candidatus Eisenbacteria bacterium]